MTRTSKRNTPFRTRSVDLGRVLIGSIDNIAEVLAITEGEGYDASPALIEKAMRRLKADNAEGGQQS